ADEAVAAADADPVLVDRPAPAARAARPAPGAVVLEAAVDHVVRARVDRDVIELPDGDMVEVVPVVAAVVGLVDAAVVADDEVASVARVDPHGVVVGVRAATAVVGERLAAVLGA